MKRYQQPNGPSLRDMDYTEIKYIPVSINLLCHCSRLERETQILPHGPNQIYGYNTKGSFFDCLETKRLMRKIKEDENVWKVY